MGVYSVWSSEHAIKFDIFNLMVTTVRALRFLALEKRLVSPLLSLGEKSGGLAT